MKVSVAELERMDLPVPDKTEFMAMLKFKLVDGHHMIGRESLKELQASMEIIEEMIMSNPLSLEGSRAASLYEEQGHFIFHDHSFIRTERKQGFDVPCSGHKVSGKCYNKEQNSSLVLRASTIFWLCPYCNINLCGFCGDV